MLTNEQIAQKLAMQWYGEEAYEWRVKGLTRLILTAIAEAATCAEPTREETAVELLRWARKKLTTIYKDAAILRQLDHIDTFLKAEGAEGGSDHVD